MDKEYQPSPASLFATHARTVPTRWAWCPTIGDRVEMTFVRDQGKTEVYRCPCGAEHSWTVRDTE